MTPSGVELVSGMEETVNHDPPVVTVGIGGVTTELYADLASALAPVTPEQARSMLRRLRGWSLLNGYRGSPQLDIDAATKGHSGLVAGRDGAGQDGAGRAVGRARGQSPDRACSRSNGGQLDTAPSCNGAIPPSNGIPMTSLRHLPTYRQLLERTDAPSCSTWYLFGDRDELGMANLATTETSFPPTSRGRRCESSAVRCTDGCNGNGNGYCARPVELDCHFESICESCTFFVTTIAFRPTLTAQRDDAAAKGQAGRQKVFDGILRRLDDPA